jgi:DNA-binding NarL/FixJ family response regulator
VKLPRVILADDHRMFAEGIRRLLEKDYQIVEIVEDGYALVEAAKQHEPDLILADISMPKLSGIEAARQIKELNKGIHIILLTMHDDVTYATAAAEEGIHGYVLKNSDPNELMSAIKIVLSGRSYFAPTLSDSVFDAIRAGDSAQVVKLTSRQRQILRLLAKGKSAKEIGKALDLTQKTAEYHKYRIMDLLHLKSTAELVKYAIEQQNTYHENP